MSSEPQQTLARSASVSGTSLHTGEKVTLKLQPAPVDSGIKFKRKDLEDEPTIDLDGARWFATHRPEWLQAAGAGSPTASATGPAGPSRLGPATAPTLAAVTTVLIDRARWVLRSAAA